MQLMNQQLLALFPSLQASYGTGFVESNKLVVCLTRSSSCNPQKPEKSNKEEQTKTDIFFFFFLNLGTEVPYFDMGVDNGSGRIFLEIKTMYNSTRVASRKRFVYGQSPTFLLCSWRILPWLRPLPHLRIKCLPIERSSSSSYGRGPHNDGKPLSRVRIHNHSSS